MEKVNLNILVGISNKQNHISTHQSKIESAYWKLNHILPTMERLGGFYT